MYNGLGFIYLELKSNDKVDQILSAHLTASYLALSEQLVTQLKGIWDNAYIHVLEEFWVQLIRATPQQPLTAHRSVRLDGWS